MSRRGLLLALAMLSVVLTTEIAWAQTSAPVQGLDKLTPEERALAERNLERWQRLTPEERGRGLENYRRRKSISSGFSSSSRLGISGSSAMPQIGQSPGASRRTCGCIGHV